MCAWERRGLCPCRVPVGLRVPIAGPTPATYLPHISPKSAPLQPHTSPTSAPRLPYTSLTPAPHQSHTSPTPAPRQPHASPTRVRRLRGTGAASQPRFPPLPRRGAAGAPGRPLPPLSLPPSPAAIKAGFKAEPWMRADSSQMEPNPRTGGFASFIIILSLSLPPLALFNGSFSPSLCPSCSLLFVLRENREGRGKQPLRWLHSAGEERGFGDLASSGLCPAEQDERDEAMDEASLPPSPPLFPYPSAPTCSSCNPG